jgi:hypothetical protein
MAIKETVSGREFNVVGAAEVTAVAAALLAARGIGWDISPDQAFATPA